MATPDPITLSVEGVEQLVGSKINKIRGGSLDGQEGVSGDKIDELALDLDDTELIHLANDWELAYRGYEEQIKTKQQRNKSYYLGKQKDGTPNDTKDFPIAGNLLFEAEETFIPAALAKNPEPVVYSDNTPEGNELASDTKTMLQYHADVLVLRQKLALMVRHNSIYMLAVIKHGWDKDINDIKSEVRDIRNFIFDPTCAVDVYGDMEGYVGERITVSAKEMAKRFPEHESFIILTSDGKLGTPLTYTEWWTDDFCFITFKNKVLDKHKNPYFVYPQGEEGNELHEVSDGQSVSMVVDEGANHFSKPKKPYTFLSVFSLGEQPHDVTGLIEQNIPNQNLVSRRIVQIDTNLQRSNNSIGLNGNNFNQQTGKQAANALQAGDPVLIPPDKDGSIKDGIQRFPAPEVPAAFFKDLEENKTALRESFGTQGITSQQPDEDQTARGMILAQSFDNSRIGGGIGDKLAQVADNVFNWWTQLYHVFYDTPHYASILGQMKGTEYIMLDNSRFTHNLVVSVAPDSMKPKDELTLYNQATTLFSEGNLDPQTYFTVTNFPNPEETASQVWLYKTNPQLYGQLNFPDFAAKIQEMAAVQGMAPMGAPQGAPMGAQPPAPAGNQPAPSLGEAPASASLSNVPLPT